MKDQASKPERTPESDGASEKKTSRRHLIAGATGVCSGRTRRAGTACEGQALQGRECEARPPAARKECGGRAPRPRASEATAVRATASWVSAPPAPVCTGRREAVPNRRSSASTRRVGRSLLRSVRDGRNRRRARRRGRRHPGRHHLTVWWGRRPRDRGCLRHRRPGPDLRLRVHRGEGGCGSWRHRSPGERKAVFSRSGILTVPMGSDHLATMQDDSVGELRAGGGALGRHDFLHRAPEQEGGHADQGRLDGREADPSGAVPGTRQRAFPRPPDGRSGWPIIAAGM